MNMQNTMKLISFIFKKLKQQNLLVEMNFLKMLISVMYILHILHISFANQKKIEKLSALKINDDELALNFN